MDNNSLDEQLERLIERISPEFGVRNAVVLDAFQKAMDFDPKDNAYGAAFLCLDFKARLLEKPVRGDDVAIAAHLKKEVNKKFNSISLSEGDKQILEDMFATGKLLSELDIG